jgi:hypothetical protein
MRAFEFTAELDTGALTIPPHVMAQLRGVHAVRVVLFLNCDPEDQAWRDGCYWKFLRDDNEADAVYDGTV